MLESHVDFYALQTTCRKFFAIAGRCSGIHELYLHQQVYGHFQFQ